MRANNIIKILVLLIIFISCENANISSDITHFEDKTWSKEDSLIFDYNNNTVKNLSINLRITNNNDYNYSNIYLFSKVTKPNGSVESDTLEFLMADKKGNWIGKGFSDERENIFEIKPNFEAKKTGKYKFVITHGMRNNDLNGITEIGFIINEKTNE